VHRARLQQPLPLGPEQLRRLAEAQPGEPVEEVNWVVAWVDIGGKGGGTLNPTQG
jgi:hypothetical protein